MQINYQNTCNIVVHIYLINKKIEKIYRYESVIENILKPIAMLCNTLSV